METDARYQCYNCKDELVFEVKVGERPQIGRRDRVQLVPLTCTVAITASSGIQMCIINAPKTRVSLFVTGLRVTSAFISPSGP